MSESGLSDDLDQFVSNVLGRKREQLFWQLAAPRQPDAPCRASARHLGHLPLLPPLHGEKQLVWQFT